jgi:hypothetical protein
MSWGYGDAPWDFDDGKIAVNDGDGTFGTAIDIYSCQMVMSELEVRSGVGTGDGGKTAMASKPIGVKGHVRFLGVQHDVMAIFSGFSNSSSGSAPNRVTGTVFTLNQNFTYFGIAARALASESAGDAHLFMPRCKIMGDINVTFEEENYVAIEFDFEGAADRHILHNGKPLLTDWFEHETAVAVAIPPTNRTYVIS